jgi:hypothetical protein
MRQQHRSSFRYHVAPVRLRFQTFAVHMPTCFRSKEDKDIGDRSRIRPSSRIFVRLRVTMHGRISCSLDQPN